MNYRRQSIFFPASVAFSVSLATLLLQLVQTRIYGVVFWNHLVYFIISIALLGFGISGTWLSFGKESWLARRLTLRNAAAGFVLSTLVSTILMPQVAVSSAEIFSNTARLLQLLGTYSIAVIPYFLAGWMLGTIFRDYVDRIHFLYFADLVGAGMGCLLFLVAIQPAGAINLVLLVCFFVAMPVFLSDARRRST